METGLLHLHSWFRWFLLVLMVWAILKSVMDLSGKKSFGLFSSKLTMWVTILAHIQLVLGFILYFVKDHDRLLVDMAATMKNSILRFFAIEHMAGMIIAVILITMGRSMSKKGSDSKRHKRIIWLFGIALLIILFSIPWPFREVGAGKTWF